MSQNNAIIVPTFQPGQRNLIERLGGDLQLHANVIMKIHRVGEQEAHDVE